MVAEKHCPKCHVTKPINAFNKNRSMKDGLGFYCKDCEHIFSAKWRHANPEFVKAKRLKWRNENPEKAKNSWRKWATANPEKYKQSHEKWAKAHRESIKIKTAKWRKNNREKQYINGVKWRQRNPEKVKAYCIEYQARKRKVAVEHVDYKIVFERDGGCCHLCGKKLKSDAWHLDHLIPLSKGGEHSYRNVAVTCPRCNIQKGSGRIPSQLRLFG